MIIKRNRGRHWFGRQRRLAVVAQVVGVGVCVWLAVALVFGEMGVLRYLSMREYADRLESDLSALRKETAALQKDIDRVQGDPAKIEQMARERLGYVRKGETVYQLNPKHADGSIDGRERSEKP